MRFSRSSDEYSAIAPLYDSLIGWVLAPLRREIRRLVLSKGLRSVLDICSGTGEQCRLLADAGIHIAGVDLSPAMLRVARAKGPSLIPYVRGNAAALPFGNDVFDGVILSLSLHEKTAATRATILFEASRVLKKGGTMFIADFAGPGKGLSRMTQRFIQAIEWMAGSEHYNNFKNYAGQGGIAKLPKSRGMEIQQLVYSFGNALAIAIISKDEPE